MNIVMLCNLGMSTGMMVKKLEQEAAKRNLEATVHAYPMVELDEHQMCIRDSQGLVQARTLARCSRKLKKPTGKNASALSKLVLPALPVTIQKYFLFETFRWSIPVFSPEELVVPCSVKARNLPLF